MLQCTSYRPNHINSIERLNIFHFAVLLTVLKGKIDDKIA